MSTTAVYQQFIHKVREFVLYNPTDIPVEFQWSAEVIRIPAATEVSPFVVADKFCSLKVNGEYVPGTLVLRDKYQDGRNGHQLSWDAAVAVRDKLGIDPTTGVATGEMARRGIVLLPTNPTPDDIETATKIGRDAWRKFQVETAKQTIAAFEAKTEARKKANLGPPPVSDDYMKAVALLDEHNALFRQGARESLSASPATDFSAFLRSKVEDAVNTSNIPAEDKVKAAELLLKSPEVISTAKQEFDRQQSGIRPLKPRA